MSLKLSALLNPAPDSAPSSPSHRPNPTDSYGASQFPAPEKLPFQTPTSQAAYSRTDQITPPDTANATDSTFASRYHTPSHLHFPEPKLVNSASEFSPPLTAPLSPPQRRQSSFTTSSNGNGVSLLNPPELPCQERPPPSSDAKPVHSLQHLLSGNNSNPVGEDEHLSRSNHDRESVGTSQAAVDSSKALDQIASTQTTEVLAIEAKKSHPHAPESTIFPDTQSPTFQKASVSPQRDSSAAQATNNLQLQTSTHSTSRVKMTGPDTVKQEDRSTPGLSAAPTPSASNLQVPTPTSARSSPSRETPSSVTEAKSKAKKAVVKKGTAATKTKPGKTTKRSTPAVGDSPASSRSATPALSTRLNKTAGNGRKSATPSASTAKKSEKKGKAKNDNDMADGEDEAEDGAELYCICRKPDNHKWMIACDGCDDWFHGSCVGVDEADQTLVDKFFCPNCENADAEKHTTWLRVCRLPECRNPARLIKGQESKYCSDQHGLQFFRIQIAQAKLSAAINGQGKRKRAVSETSYDDSDQSETSSELSYSNEKPKFTNARGGKGRGKSKAGGKVQKERRTPGGSLTRSQLAAMIKSTVKETEDENSNQFNNLGDADEAMMVDIPEDQLNEAEKATLTDLATVLGNLARKSDMLKAKEKFIGLVKERAKTIERRDGIKGLCGYDPRLSWEDEGFEAWRQSPRGQKVMAEESLDAEFSDDEMKDEAETENGEANNTGESDQEVCHKKRCGVHNNWRTLVSQEVKLDMRKCFEEELRVKEEQRVINVRAAMRISKNGESEGKRKEGWVEKVDQAANEKEPSDIDSAEHGIETKDRQDGEDVKMEG